MESTANSDDFTIDRTPRSSQGSDDDEHFSDADGANGSSLVASCIARAADKRELPVRRTSLGMALVGDLIAAAMTARTMLVDDDGGSNDDDDAEPDCAAANVDETVTARSSRSRPVSASSARSSNMSGAGSGRRQPQTLSESLDEAARLTLARSMVDGLCDVVLRDTSARAITRSVRAAAAQRKRREQLHRRGAGGQTKADAIEQEFAAILVQRWARGHRVVTGRRRGRAAPDDADPNAAGADGSMHEEAEYAARLVQGWVRQRLARRSRSRSPPAADDDDDPLNEDANQPASASPAPITSSTTDGGTRAPRTQAPDDSADDDEEDYSRVDVAGDDADNGDAGDGDAAEQSPSPSLGRSASEAPTQASTRSQQQQHSDAAMSPEEREERRLELQRRVVARRRQLVTKYMQLGGPKFRSEMAARAFLGRTVALSRTERVSRNDLEGVYDAFCFGVRHHMELLADLHARDHAQRHELLSEERRCRAEVTEDEYGEFVCNVHHATWALRYGTESADGYESLCIEVDDAEAHERSALYEEERAEWAAVLRIRPHPRRRTYRSSAEAGLDAAHGGRPATSTSRQRQHRNPNLSGSMVSSSPQGTTDRVDEQSALIHRSVHALSAAPTRASLARESVLEQRRRRAAKVRGEADALADARDALRVDAMTSKHDIAASRRDERHERHEMLSRSREAQRAQRQADARLEALARRQIAEARRAPPKEAAELDDALRRLQVDPDRPLGGVEKGRDAMGVARPQSSANSAKRRNAANKRSAAASTARAPSVTPSASTITADRDTTATGDRPASSSRYSTAEAYGGPERPSTRAGSTAQQQQQHRSANQQRNSRSLPPLAQSTLSGPRAPTPLVKARATALMPVEAKLSDDLTHLLADTKDFTETAKAHNNNNASSKPHDEPPPALMVRPLRLKAHTLQAQTVRDTLAAADLVDLSPRSRMTRWNTEASALISDRQLPAARKVLRTVHHELTEYAKALQKQQQQQPAVPIVAREQYALKRIEAELEQNEAAACKAEGHVIDAVKHLQRRMAAEEGMMRAFKEPHRRDPLVPPPLLSAATGLSCDSMLSVSALLTAIEEPDGALQYGRAAARVVSAGAIELRSAVRRAGEAGEWPSQEEIAELEEDVKRVGQLGCMCLHNIAMAQLVCPNDVRLGERAASPTTFRACVRLGELVLGAESPFVARLKGSSGHFARIMSQPSQANRNASPAGPSIVASPEPSTL